MIYFVDGTLMIDADSPEEAQEIAKANNGMIQVYQVYKESEKDVHT